MATLEEDTLRTLQRIEKILKDGSTTTGLGRSAPRGAGMASRDDDSGGKMSPKARKSFQATTAVLNNLNTSARTLNKSFTGLSKTVLNTRGNFVALNRSMRAFSRDSPQPTPTGGQERIPATPENKNKGKKDPLKALPPFLENLVRGFRDTLKENRLAQERRDLAAAAGGGAGGPRPPGPGELLADQMGPRGPGGKAGKALTGLTAKVSGATRAVGGFALALSAAIIPLTRDILMLHSAGIEASSALGGLYIDAARSGMSLKDYTKVLQESSVAVTRSGSMADFNNTLQRSRNQLAGLGIFGEEATRLSASLASSTTALGIPQERLNDATNAQIKTFEHLRKTSLLTAKQFQELTAGLAENQVVQSQLLGMAPAQRATRFNELIQIKSIGLSMGSTKKASDELGEALIATRNLTAPKRFEAAGRIRQAGAMFGMDSGETEQLARLSRKKIRSPEEDRQVVAIGARLQAAIERSSQSGDISEENRAEQMQAALDATGFGEVLKKAGNVGLTAQSGQAGVNKDFAKGTSQLLQFTGEAMAWLDGLKQNTIIKALGGAGLGTAIGVMLGRLMGGAAGGAGGGGILSSIGGMISSAFGALKSGLGRIFGLLNPATWNLGGTLGSIGRFVKGLGGALKVGAGALLKLSGIGTVIMGLFDGIAELFTQTITSAFNPDGGGGFKEVIGNAVFGIFNGFVGSIGWLMDAVVGLFTDDGFHFENALNKFAVLMKAGFMQVLANILDSVKLGWTPMGKYFQKAADDSYGVLQKLEEDNTATVLSIGKANDKEIESKKKLADKTTETAAKLTAANAGILTTTNGIVGGLVSHAATVATPAPVSLKSVTPPTVNKPETETAVAAATEAPAPATGVPTDAIVAQLVAMTNLLTTMLTAEELQAAGISALASAAGRPVFANNDRMFDLLQSSRYST